MNGQVGVESEPGVGSTFWAEFPRVQGPQTTLDILIVDDNSPDGTAKVVEEYKKKFDNLNLIVRKGKEGLDTAHKLAFKFAPKQASKIMNQINSDDKKISKLLRKLGK